MTPEVLAEILDKPQVARGLFIIRLADIDPESQFHERLLYSLEACPPDASDGDLVTAIRFVVTQEKAQALDEHARADNEARRWKRLEARRHRVEGRVAQTKAERMVEEDDSYWDLKLRADVALARATACTDMLFALQAATDTWRTGRADDRAADRWHQHNGT